jgi:MFS family permease
MSQCLAAVAPISLDATGLGLFSPVNAYVAPRSPRTIIRRYYAVRLIDAVGPSFVLINNVLFMQARGLTQFEISCWAATYFMVAFLTDVPMGAFADTISRRLAYVLGCGLGAVSFLTYFFAHHYLIFIVAAVVGGLGDMLRNGAIDAWAVDTLGSAGYEGRLDLLFSRAAQLMQFGAIFGVVIGGRLTMRNIAIPWLLGAAGQLIMAAAAGWLMRGERPRIRSLEPARVARSMRGHIVAGIIAAFSSRPVLTLGIANAITMIAWSPFWYEWPQFFNSSFHQGTQVASWVYVGTAIATMLGAEVVARRQPGPSLRPFFMFAVIAIQSGLLFASGLMIHQPMLVLVFFLCSSACTGISNPIGLSWYNEQVDGAHRATLLSFQSTCARLGAAVGLPIGGWLADAHGFAITWQVMGIVAALSAPLYLSLRFSFLRRVAELKRAMAPRESA